MTEPRWLALCERLEKAEARWSAPAPARAVVTGTPQTERHVCITTPTLSAQLDRRRGLARGLMTRAIEEAGRWPGLRQINLGVNAANSAAIALYESLGFQTFGIERGFMQVDGVLHDERHMVRILTTGTE